MSKPIYSLINEQIKALNPKASLSRKEDTLRLDKGEFPYPPSPKVITAINEAANSINRYPDTLGDTLRDNLAHYTGQKLERIVVGNGSDDLIELILKVFVGIGEEVLLPIPTFFVYEFATKVVGGVPVWVERTEDFGLNPKTVLEKVTSKTKVLFIANPNNPTANSIARETIIELLNQFNGIIVVDECYYEFSQETVVDLIDVYPNLIVLRSLSKSFGLAGLRIGYGIAQETVIDYLYRAAQLFPVNKLAIAAGNAALQDIAYIDDKIAQINQSKIYLSQALEQLGLVVYPSATNFLFIGTEAVGITSQQLVQSLAEKNILVADFGLKQGLNAYYFRTAIGTDEENERLIEGLKDIIIEQSLI